MKVISIGYGRHLFDPNNPETKRQLLCAKAVTSLDMIIFTSKSDKLAVTRLENGLTLHPTNSNNKLGMLKDAYTIGSQLIKEYSTVDVVTSQDPFEAGLVGWLLKLRFKFHFTIQEHGDVYSNLYWRNESLFNFVRYYLGLVIIRSADTLRVVSKRTEKFFTPRLRKSQTITRLSVAIDTSAFIAARPSAARTFPLETFTFISAARFVPQKNLFLMIDSFLAAYKKNNSLRLILLGEGKQKEALLRHITETLKVSPSPITVKSWSSTLADEMASADAYLLTSNYEGWGRVLIESLVVSLPIVTTDVGCVGEVVKDRQHGLVVPTNNQPALTGALLEISTDSNLYNQICTNIHSLNISSLSGTNLAEYGQQWRDSLT